MNRRHFMGLAVAASIVPLSAKAEVLEYKPGLVAERLAAGETVFLDFRTSWCTTCQAQKRVIHKLRAKNAAYDESITFINVNWDRYSRSDLANRLNIPRRSTLVVLKGDQELGRIVAGTRKRAIQKLMDIALNA